LTKYHAVLEYDPSDRLAKVICYDLRSFDFTLLWNCAHKDADILDNVRLYISNGELPDYIANPLSWPIFSGRLIDIICNFAQVDIELLECHIFIEHSEQQVLGFKAVNTLKQFAALDPIYSRISRDKDGMITAVHKIAVLDDKIDSDVHIFRLIEWPYPLIISDELARALVGRRLVGIALERL